MCMYYVTYNVYVLQDTLIVEIWLLVMFFLFTFYRMAVRLGAGLLHKVVDCLAPSLSSVLVKEKEVKN